MKDFRRVLDRADVDVLLFAIFLDCRKSRQAPVENLEVGHFVFSVAHWGNIARRRGRDITWDAKAKRIVGDPNADRLLSVEYRPPWKLPYYRV